MGSEVAVDLDACIDMTPQDVISLVFAHACLGNACDSDDDFGRCTLPPGFEYPTFGRYMYRYIRPWT